MIAVYGIDAEPIKQPRRLGGPRLRQRCLAHKAEQKKTVLQHAASAALRGGSRVSNHIDLLAAKCGIILQQTRIFFLYEYGSFHFYDFSFQESSIGFYNDVIDAVKNLIVVIHLNLSHNNFNVACCGNGGHLFRKHHHALLHAVFRRQRNKIHTRRRVFIR